MFIVCELKKEEYIKALTQNCKKVLAQNIAKNVVNEVILVFSPEPVVMPGFPVRTMQSHPPPPYSPTR
jgi:hypothetical protein